MDTRGNGHKVWTQELTLLLGRSSQLGAPGRDLETAEAERLNVGGAVMSEAVRALNARTARILFHFNFDFDLQDTARRVRLGITAQELTPDVGAYFGANVGVLVASMVADSPAARAGLRASDVITSVDGRSVTSGNDLVRELREVSGDGGVTLGIVRDKKESSRTAKIDVEPDRRARPARPIRSTPVA